MQCIRMQCFAIGLQLRIVAGPLRHTPVLSDCRDASLQSGRGFSGLRHTADSLGAVQGRLGLSSGALGLSRRLLRWSFWDSVMKLLSLPGARMRRLEVCVTLFGFTWAVVRPSGRGLWPSGVVSGASWVVLERSWRCPGQSWALRERAKKNAVVGVPRGGWQCRAR